MIQESLKNSMNKGAMFSKGSGKDENIVHINDNMASVDKITKGTIHELLEGGWGVAETKKHDKGFKEATIGFEGGFPFISFLDSDIMVALVDIQLGEVDRIFEFIEECWDEG